MRELSPFTLNLFDIATAVNLLIQGRNNVFGEITLTPNDTTTTVESLAFTETSVPILTPLTAHAAAEMAAGTLYVSEREKGSFTLTHANNAQNDRTFGYVVLGG